MTEAKFTKGPWHIDFTDEIYDSDGNNLADVWLFDIQDLEAAEANAHLISAAPDMYEALVSLLSVMETTECDKLFRADYARAKEVLRKARGEQ